MTTGPESTDRRVAREPEPTDTGTSARPTEPAASRPAEPAATRPAVEDTPDVNTKGGKTAGLWISLILGAVVLILLLIFVIQNNVKATFEYFGAQFDLPLGVAMLLAAIAGALVMALVGSVRMVQMSWTIRKLRKNQERIRGAVR